MKNIMISLLFSLLCGVSFAQIRMGSTLNYDENGQLSHMAWPALGPAYSFPTVEMVYDNEVGIPSNIKYFRSLAYGQGNSEIPLNYHAVLDTAGNITNLYLTDTFSNIKYKIQKQYDVLGRLTNHNVVHAPQNTYSYIWKMHNIQYNEWGYVSRYSGYQNGKPLEYAYFYNLQGALKRHSRGANMDYAYDAFGNLTRSTAASTADLEMKGRNHTYNHHNQATDVDDQGNPIYLYDASGRLIKDAKYQYKYRKDGRLAAIVDHRGWVVESYKYAADGHRVGVVSDKGVKAFGRVATDVSSVEEYRLNQLTHRTDYVSFPGGEYSRTYDWNPTLNRYEERGQYQFSDYTDSSPLSVRAGSGNLSYTDYGPYGQQTQVNYEDHQGPYGFTGHENDASGLTYMKARYYAPGLAKFLSPDPAQDMDLSVPSSMNLYQYSYNNPINFNDPTGMAPGELMDDIELLAKNINIFYETAFNSYISNVVLFGAFRIDPNDYPTDVQFGAKLGQVFGDAASLATGTAEFITGVGLVGGSVVAAPVAVVGAGPSLGGTVVIDGGVFITGAVIGSHGLLVVIPASLVNLEDSTRELTQSWYGEHTKGARPSTSGKHDKANRRRKNDKGGESADSRRYEKPKKAGGGPSKGTSKNRARRDKKKRGQNPQNDPNDPEIQ